MDLGDIDRERFGECVATGKAYALSMLKVKVTWRCNLTCAMCNYWRRTDLPELSTAEWQRVIDEACELGCRKIHISGGEALLRPDLEQLISRAASRGLRVNLTSNGTLLTEDRAESLIAAGINSVTFSIDSPRRKTHDGIRGAGAWRATIAGAKCLRRSIKKHHAKVRLRINVVVSKRNYHSLGDLPQIATRLGARAVLLIPVDDTEGRGLRLGKQQILAYNTSLAGRLAEAGVQPSYPFGQSSREILLSSQGMYARGEYDQHPCLIPWIHSFILPDGSVFPCCMRHDAGPRLGNAIESPLAAIWEGAEYAQFRKSLFGAGSVEPCARCDDFLAENRELCRIAGLYRFAVEERGAGQ